MGTVSLLNLVMKHPKQIARSWQLPYTSYVLASFYNDSSSGHSQMLHANTRETLGCFYMAILMHLQNLNKIDNIINKSCLT